MRIRGFGRNYFTLAAIQAYSSERTLNARQTFESILEHSKMFDSEEIDTSPPDELLSAETITKEPESRPCHCNCFYKNRSKNALYLAFLHQAPLCRCRKTKSGIAPPALFPTS